MSPSPSILDRLPLELRTRRWVELATSPEDTAGAEAVAGEGESVLPLGRETLDRVLPGGGLPRGGVVEFTLQGAAALGTTLALEACRAAQQSGGRDAWCGFVDPSGTLHAPGVAGRGVNLERLLVVRPPLEVLSRVVLRLVEARTLALIVVDTVGTPQAPLDVHLGPWVRVVRRLSLALQGTASTVVLLTDKSAPRPLALPVTTRIELQRPRESELRLTVTKDPQGRLLPPTTIAVRELGGATTGERPGLSSPPARRLAGAA